MQTLITPALFYCRHKRLRSRDKHLQPLLLLKLRIQDVHENGNEAEVVLKGKV